MIENSLSLVGQAASGVALLPVGVTLARVGMPQLSPGAIAIALTSVVVLPLSTYAIGLVLTSHEVAAGDSPSVAPPAPRADDARVTAGPPPACPFPRPAGVRLAAADHRGKAAQLAARPGPPVRTQVAYRRTGSADGRRATKRDMSRRWGIAPLSAISVGQAVVLGVVEGVTEFLPVSSTGHLKIAEGLMGIPVDDEAVVGFSAVIQVGAIAAVLVYFFKDIVRIVSRVGPRARDREERYHHDYKFAWWVIYATIPIVVVGLAAKPLIEGPLASLWVVAGSLIVGSGVMWAADQMGRHKRGEDDTSFKDAMLVGSSQILALLFPGFSRSGATMSTALILDLDRRRRHPALVLPRHPRPHRRRHLRAEGRPRQRGRRRPAGRRHASSPSSSPTPRSPGC